MPEPDLTGAYLHGYATPEQERLIAQAEHWRELLILDGTSLDPGTRLLEIGCGVGAVLGVLATAFPGLAVTGVDIEPRQLDFAREHLSRLGISADLRVADARHLPLSDESFDHVWMMWFLEHLPAPGQALREARRVLVPGGAITAIEADYGTVSTTPSTPELRALFAALVQGMSANGHSDAGAQTTGWLADAGFVEVAEGRRIFAFDGCDAGRQACYWADILDGVIDELATLPDAAPRDQLREGLVQLRGLDSHPGAHMEWVVYKATARRPSDASQAGG